MEISISTALYYNRDYISILNLLEKTNCNNIELFLNQPFIDIPITDLKREISKRNLMVTSIHLPLTFLAYERNQTEEFWIKQGLDYLKEFDADILVTHFSDNPSDSTRNNDESHLANIEKYSKTTSKFICTENMPRIHAETILKNPEKLVGFLENSGASITFDTTHAASNERDIIETYKIYSKYVKNIHLSDYEDGNEHKIVNEGVLPIKRFLEQLITDNYQYNITLEYDFEKPSRNIIRSDEDAIERINKSIEYVKNVLHL